MDPFSRHHANHIKSIYIIFFGQGKCLNVWVLGELFNGASWEIYKVQENCGNITKKVETGSIYNRRQKERIIFYLFWMKDDHKFDTISVSAGVFFF